MFRLRNFSFRLSARKPLNSWGREIRHFGVFNDFLGFAVVLFRASRLDLPGPILSENCAPPRARTAPADIFNLARIVFFRKLLERFRDGWSDERAGVRERSGPARRGVRSARENQIDRKARRQARPWPQGSCEKRGRRSRQPACGPPARRRTPVRRANCASARSTSMLAMATRRVARSAEMSARRSG